MALKGKYFISNATKEAITVGAITVPAGKVVEAEVDVEAHPQYLAELVSKGCAVTLASLTNASGSVAANTAEVVTAVTLAEASATRLVELIRSTASIGADPFGAYGA